MKTNRLVQPLGIVATILMGQSPPGETYNSEGVGLPFFQGKAEFGDEFPTPMKWCSSPTRVAEAGDVLLSVRAPVGPTNTANQRCCIGRGLAAIRAKEGLTLNKYVRYFLRRFEVELARKGVGSTFTAINRNEIERMGIPIPSLPEQNRIVGLLDEAGELRRRREQADRRTADLIPALFYEIFGDPATNPMRWKTRIVEALFPTDRTGARCGPFGSTLKKQEYVEAGIPVWGIDNVQPNLFTGGGSLFITEEKYKQLTNYTVEPGDILISRAGTVGRMCVAGPPRSPSIIGTNLIRLALNRSVIEPEYFTALFTHFGERIGRLRANADTGAYSFMNTSVLRSLEIPVPPLPLQNEFAARVADIRALEARQAESRRRLDDLFQSMLHRAFQGEL